MSLRQDARAFICGLTGYVAREHIARAALEAVAFQVMHVVLAMEQEAGLPLSSLRVDGGMDVNEMLMQFQVLSCKSFYVQLYIFLFSIEPFEQT